VTTAVAIITSVRPAQWLKNVLVFAPLIFARQALEPHALVRSLAVFALFCLASGAVYLVNDLLDRASDREHPVKCRRPIASGALSPAAAAAAAALIGVVALSAAALLDRRVAFVIVIYLLVNLLYSRLLKHLVILDVMTIAAGFVLRVVAGGIAVGVALSSWLLLCTSLLALFLGFGKRRHELVLLEVNASTHRPILSEYSPYFLDQLIAVVTTSTLVTYALYTMDPLVHQKLGTANLPLTIPFVLYGIFRYLYLVHQKQEGGDPSQIVFNDKALLVNIVLWIATVFAILYYH
jgi:4-hydroxybenzoate polyprenyltransferase